MRIQNIIFGQIYILVFILMSSCSTSSYYPVQRGSNTIGGMPTDPGKCFAKCMIPDKVDIDSLFVLVYTGDDFEAKGIKKKKIILQEGSTKWVRRKADRNCMSSNPDDCFVWCLIDEDRVVEEVYEVTDTILVREYEQKIFEKKKIVKKGGLTEWREVICNNDVTPDLFKKVQTALLDKGYDIGPQGIDGIVSRETKEALVKYQKDNGLPVGQLDVETLEALGVRN